MYVEGDSEGVRFGFNTVGVEEVEEGVVEGEGWLEVDEVDWGTEVDDDEDVELSLEELVGGGVLDVDGL